MPRSFHKYLLAFLAILAHGCTSRNVRIRSSWNYTGPGLFRNNAVVCKYSWKQCGRDLTFWDSYSSVSFFVYRRMYRSRKPRYLMQKRRCIPRDESGCLRLVFDVCVSRPNLRERVLLSVMISPRIILPRELTMRTNCWKIFSCSLSETYEVGITYSGSITYSCLQIRKIPLVWK